jgi:hypothetical protein
VSELIARLPRWLAPSDDDRTPRRAWRLETAILVALGLFLAIASINDLAQTVNDNTRLVADQQTWRHYTHRDYFNVTAAPLVVGQPIDLSCADATPGPPGERTQICLLITGPIRDGRRSVVGGFRLPARTGNFPQYRYSCYGEAVGQHLCAK